MAKEYFKDPDSTGNIIYVEFVDANGDPVTDILHDDADLHIYGVRQGAVESEIATVELATPAADDPYLSGGFIHVGGEKYRLDVPNSFYAAGVEFFELRGEADAGATQMLPVKVNLNMVSQSDIGTEIGGYFDEMTEDDGGTKRFTLNALEQAPSGGGSSPWSGAQVAEVLAELDGILARLPASLTANGNIAASLQEIVDSAAAADNLKTTMDTVIRTTVEVAPAPTDTSFKGPDSLSAVDNFYNGRIVIFTTGPLALQVTKVEGYVGATNVFTVTQTTGAPADGNEFVLI